MLHSGIREREERTAEQHYCVSEREERVALLRQLGNKREGTPEGTLRQVMWSWRRETRTCLSHQINMKLRRSVLSSE